MSNEFLDGADNVPQDTIETNGSNYGYIQWVNGQQALYSALPSSVLGTGGWFMDAKYSETVPTGWSEGELPHRKGESTPGYFIPILTVAAIRSRKCWVIKQERNELRFGWTAYEEAKKQYGAKKLKSRLHILVRTPGIEAPMVLTLSGTTGGAIIGSGQTPGVFGDFNAQVIAAANKLNAARGNPNKFAYRCFWMKIGSQRDANGTPVYSTVGNGSETSMVTFPVLNGLPAKVDQPYLAKAYVGKDNLAKFNEDYAAAEGWAHAWDTGLGEVAPESPDEPF